MAGLSGGDVSAWSAAGREVGSGWAAGREMGTGSAAGREGAGHSSLLSSLDHPSTSRM